MAAIWKTLRVDTDQTLFVRDKRCEGPFQDAVRALPGVRGEACSSLTVLPELVAVEELKRREGKSPLNLHIGSVGYGLFELYGLSPIAGRFFSRQHGGDSIPPDELIDDPNRTIQRAIHGARSVRSWYFNPCTIWRATPE